MLINNIGVTYWGLSGWLIGDYRGFGYQTVVYKAVLDCYNNKMEQRMKNLSVDQRDYIEMMLIDAHDHEEEAEKIRDQIEVELSEFENEEVDVTPIVFHVSKATVNDSKRDSKYASSPVKTSSA